MKTAIKIAWRFLTHAKGQSILIAIGIAVGVSVQVFIGSLIAGLQAELVDTAIGRNTQITVTAKTRGGVIKGYQALVEQIEQRLAEGTDPAEISVGLGVTQYVVAVIADDEERSAGSPRPQRKVSRRVPNSKPRIDATTIRMIQRMLAAWILSHVEIAREAGISKGYLFYYFN